MGDPGRGLAPLRRAAQLDPGRSDAHYNLGLALGRVGDPDGAAREMDWLRAYAPVLASQLEQQLGEAQIRARTHDPLPEREDFVPQETDRSITLLGVSAGDGIERWDSAGAEDAIVGSWGGAFKKNGGVTPLGQGVLTVTQAGEGMYRVQLTSGWVKMDIQDDSPLFQGCTLRFVGKRGSGFNSIFTYEGESGAFYRDGSPQMAVFHLKPAYGSDPRLVTYIGGAGPSDPSGLVRLGGGS
jgi:hypothetical protein